MAELAMYIKIVLTTEVTKDDRKAENLPLKVDICETLYQLMTYGIFT